MATARKAQTAEALDPEFDPNLSEVTRPSDLGFGKAREVVVEPLQERSPQMSDDGYMEIRMAETVEEFTYGNPHYMTRLDEGKLYRVPQHIGLYLIGLGKVYTRGA